MTGSFGIEGAQFTIRNGTRLVSTTDGTLVCLLPDLVDLSGIVASWPDPANRDYAYAFHYRQDRNILATPDAYIQLNQCQVFFTRRPQEYLAEQVLVAAPAGADIFVGTVRLSRTTAPSHTWLGAPLTVLVKEGQWMPWSGSALLEAGLGIARAMHIKISGGNLVLQRQMSVSTPAGGYGSYGTIASPAADNIEGDEILYQTGPGIPAWTSTSAPYWKQSQRESATDSPVGPSDYEVHRNTGSDPCSTTDPTNYTSTYSVDVKGHFGRRS